MCNESSQSGERTGGNGFNALIVSDGIRAMREAAQKAERDADNRVGAAPNLQRAQDIEMQRQEYEAEAKQYTNIMQRNYDEATLQQLSDSFKDDLTRFATNTPQTQGKYNATKAVLNTMRSYRGR